MHEAEWSESDTSGRPTASSLRERIQSVKVLLRDLGLEGATGIEEVLEVFDQLLLLVHMQEMGNFVHPAQAKHPLGESMTPGWQWAVEDVMNAARAGLLSATDPSSVEAVEEGGDVPNWRAIHEVLALILRASKSTLDLMVTTIESTRDSFRDYSTLATLRTAGERIEALEVKERLRRLDLDAQGLYDNAKEAIQDSTGAAAELSLSAEYEALADAQGRSANTWRWVAVAGFVLLIVLGALAVAFGPASEGWALLRKALVAIPGAGLVGYAIHESAEHRKMEAWAREQVVHLRSIRAYTADMKEDDRLELRRQFGLRVFLTPSPVPAKAQSVAGLVAASGDKQESD